MPETGVSAPALRQCMRDENRQHCAQRDYQALGHTLVCFGLRGKLEIDAAIAVLLGRSAQIEIVKSNFLAMSGAQIV
jgi:hypothetical protein